MSSTSNAPTSPGIQSVPPSYATPDARSQNSLVTETDTQEAKSEAKPKIKRKWLPRGLGYELLGFSKNPIVSLVIFIASLIQIIVFVKLHAEKSGSKTKVTIHASGATKVGQEYQGRVRIIWAFDGANHPLGSSDVDPAFIHQSQSKEIAIHHHAEGGSQGQYIDLIASDDEICISWISVIMATGSKLEWIWKGDVGAQCGQAWEYSKESLSEPNEKTTYGKCVWMDADDGKGIQVNPVHITNRQMKINMFAYGGQAKNETLDYICGATIFSHDDRDPIAEPTPRGPRAQSNLKDKRAPYVHSRQTKSPRKRNERSASELVVNSRPEQSAVQLCNSPTSRGSDFASVDEGLFCDMETKTLYPLCTAEVQSACFDIEREKLQMVKRDAPGMQARDVPAKTYKRFVHVD